MKRAIRAASFSVKSSGSVMRPWTPFRMGKGYVIRVTPT